MCLTFFVFAAAQDNKYMHVEHERETLYHTQNWALVHSMGRSD